MSQTKTPTEITAEFIARAAAGLGLDMHQENKSWIVFQDQRTKHKICVSFTKGEAPWIDTTVDITALPGVALRGRDAKPNGKFVSLFRASEDLIVAALTQMAAPDCAPLPPTRRTKKAPVAFRLPTASSSVREGTEADLTAGLD